jgi:hypothetical protein
MASNQSYCVSVHNIYGSCILLYLQIDQIQSAVKHCCDELKVDLILTSGGKCAAYNMTLLMYTKQILYIVL